MAYSALQLNSNALYQAVNQVAHGFLPGDVIRFNGTKFVLANNLTRLDSSAIGIVSSYVNSDQFYFTQEGFVSGLDTVPTEGGFYIPGDQYYLSGTSGELTAIEPTTLGEYLVPLFVAQTATSGYFSIQNVQEITNLATEIPWITVIANTSMDVNKNYLINGAGVLDMLLPSVSSVGDVIRIATLGINGCSVIQDVLQSLTIVDEESTIGVGGETVLLATNGILSGSILIVCTVANKEWKSLSGTGTWDPI